MSIEQKEQFQTLGEGLLVRAPAKINLSLLVDGLRPDGYHEIETIMAKVTLFDELLIEPGTAEGIELVCKGPCHAPEGKDNLVYKAAAAALEAAGTAAAIKITLTKNIPAGAGLGGASSDAAATLSGVNKFGKLGLTGETLRELAAALGSDVPFFLGGPLALCQGRGEKITKLEQNFDFIAVLLLPDVSVSTKTIYEAYRESKVEYESLHDRIKTLLGENRIDLITRMCANMLSKSCFSLYGSLAELKGKAEEAVLAPVCLTGSGAGMYCIVANAASAGWCKKRIEQEIGCKTVIVSNNRW